MMEADRLLAERLQSKEREELTDEEKAKLFMELIENRRKHFAALRAQEKRNIPPTKAHNRTQISTYLKHMAMGFEQKEDAWKEKSRERTTAGILKEQKVEEEKESDTVDEYDEAELKKLLVIKKDKDIAIDAIPLATKLPVIIDYKLHKEGMMCCWWKDYNCVKTFYCQEDNDAKEITVILENKHIGCKISD
ncbi:hypothetical protein Tco_1317597 [Tanacetum coccineum]